MNIDVNVLRSFGGEEKIYKSKEFIFEEGDHASYYFQIIFGRVKLNSYNEEGKEFIHNILGKDQSFGDPLLFLDKTYPMNAICMEMVKVIRVSKQDFIEMLNQHNAISLEMNKCLAQRLYYKILMAHNMVSLNPALRIKGLLDYLKSFHHDDCKHSFPVELSRQQIANLTGLRVETVIRTIKKMESSSTVKLTDKKIFY